MLGGIIAIYGVEAVRAKVRFIAECDDVWTMAAVTTAQGPAAANKVMAGIKAQKSRGKN